VNQQFTAEQVLNTFKYYCHCHLMCGAEAVSDQTIDFADVENYSFENIFEMVNAEYIGK